MTGRLAAAGAGYGPTRLELQRIATHVVARARHAATGRFGLRVTPGGFGTPAFGDATEVVRVRRDALVREVAPPGGATTTALPLAGATLQQLAVAAGVTLDPMFSVGGDTPDLGEIGQPVALDPDAVAVVLDWFVFGGEVLDRVVTGLDASARPSVVQLWPEHFDLGVDVGVGTERRANLGASAGDGPDGAPYLYVGPWGEERPGDPGYWNASFGAVLAHADLVAAADPVEAGVAFLRRGIELLVSG
ncbi:MAG: hypothetical protein S0880_27010 [Actinomycetota bacterium]|nr:hypothetical protein [Actinomycetota bacterium]